MKRTRVLVIGENTLGHVSFLNDLEERAAHREDVHMTVVRLPFEPGRVLGRIPLLRSNWTLRASLLAM